MKQYSFYKQTSHLNMPITVLLVNIWSFQTTIISPNNGQLFLNKNNNPRCISQATKAANSPSQYRQGPTILLSRDPLSICLYSFAKLMSYCCVPFELFYNGICLALSYCLLCCVELLPYLVLVCLKHNSIHIWVTFMLSYFLRTLTSSFRIFYTTCFMWGVVSFVPELLRHILPEL